MFDVGEMKILHINTLQKGGASRSCIRLHQALLRSGYDSNIMFAPPLPMDWPSRIRRRFERLLIDSCNVIGKTPGWLLREQHYASTRPAGCELYSDDKTRYFGTIRREQLASCDVINLHWVAWFLDYRNFFSMLPAQTPVVWRLSDMNPFTGGCHYSDGCQRYNSGCGACPQLGSDDPHDLSHQVWQRKKLAYDQLATRRLHIVAQSHWMAGVVAQSELFGRFPVTVIPNGLDVDTFSPRDTSEARRHFGIPEDAQVILFVAESVDNRRKGFDLLSAALNHLDDTLNPFLVSAGLNEPEMHSTLPHRHVGAIQDDGQLAMLYSAADVFVIPSREDNLPNTVLESMACGTPVVGFDVGGIPDMVRPDVTGLLAPSEDACALGQAISRVLGTNTARESMAANCRRIVVGEYSLEVQASRFAALYASMLGKSL